MRSLVEGEGGGGLLHSDGGHDFTSDERSMWRAWREKG